MAENKIAQNNSETRLILGGDLVASAVPEARSSMRQLLQEGLTQLTVDLANVNMIDSAGIGCLVAAHNSLAKQEGRLKVINASADIFELFVSMRLDRHFSVSRRD